MSASSAVCRFPRLQDAEKAESTRRQIFERKAKEQAQKDLAEAKKKAFEDVRGRLTSEHLN